MSARQKTILKTVRIRKDLDELLQDDAKVKRTSVNGLMAAIMTKYSEWDRFADRFGYVSLQKDLFRDLLEAANDETRNSVSRTSARQSISGSRKSI